jgi:hypothetical protein
MAEEQVQKEQAPVSADLLKQAALVPQGLVVEDYNPMEQIPTLAVGEDGEFKPGMTVAGYYEETQRISSPKFIHSKEVDEAGVKVQYRHVLRIGSLQGERLGIWTTGELRTAFKKLTPGTFVVITYKNRGVNAKGQKQHFFEFKKGIAAVTQ